MGVNRERRDKRIGGLARSIEVGAAFMLQFTNFVEFQIGRVWVAEKQDAPSATTSVGLGPFEGL